jgi:23S rRNA G2445 N2-methylase RlmL
LASNLPQLRKFAVMQLFQIKSRIVITCSYRLAPYLQQEVEALGYQPTSVFKTGVSIDGSMADCIRLNLNLRCASQVLFSLKAFKAANAQDIYDALTDFAWEDILAADSYFSVTSNVQNDTIDNSLFVNVRVKDAIVDRFRKLTGQRPDSGPENDKAVINLFWKDQDAEVFVDTSGQTLSKHGYRKIPGKAPMMESLAAATLLATRWNRHSPFINPMCGSGTLAIEAALLATNRRPGLYRFNYGFMHLKGYVQSLFETAHQALEQQVIDLPALVIIASDISQDAVDIAKINAGIAGVEEMIHFEVCDFRQTKVPPDAGGVIYVNPEYGDRMGDIAALETTYKAIGDFMKQQCKGYTGYIFTGNLDLAKKIGLKPTKRIEFYTGKIDCRLLEYELYSGTKRDIT